MKRALGIITIAYVGILEFFAIRMARRGAAAMTDPEKHGINGSFKDSLFLIQAHLSILPIGLIAYFVVVCTIFWILKRTKLASAVIEIRSE